MKISIGNVNNEFHLIIIQTIDMKCRATRIHEKAKVGSGVMEE
jgi:hypothetical protein